MSIDRRSQLIQLERALQELVQLLEKDPACRWTRHFRAMLSETRALLETGFTNDDLALLSRDVVVVYQGGMGSFGDYVPARLVAPDEGKGPCEIIPGMEGFDAVSRLVYERAVALRVIGTR